MTLTEYLSQGTSIVTWVMAQASTIMDFIVANPIPMTFILLTVISFVIGLTKRFFRV